jgi:dihydrofolate reductase
MIRLIAAIDSRRGLATDEGIPWHLAGDVAYFRQRTEGGLLIMGRATYAEFAAPLEGRANFVLTRDPSRITPGFRAVTDLALFLETRAGEDVWVIGGAMLYASTLAAADELLLTQVDGDFGCTKFFPAYAQSFVLERDSEDHEEGGVHYRFETWRPAPSPPPSEEI